MRSCLYIALLGALFFSCESFLDRPPLDRISSDSYWKTAKDLENYVIQFYPALPGHGTWDGAYGYPVTNADNLIRGNHNAALNGELGITGGRWISDWSRIRSVNVFMDNYRQCKDSPAIYEQYVGEAHFFRAWFYFNLVKKYGDVPWISSELKVNSAELTKGRDPRTMVVDSILGDLDKAIGYLKGRSVVGNNRINKETALAFKSRIGLYEGTWQKYHAGTVFGTTGANPEKYFKACVDASEELMKGSYVRGIYDTGVQKADYYELFGLDNMSAINEVLLYRAYNMADGVRNDVQYATTSATNQMGVTWDLVSSYLGKNGRPYDYLGLAASKKGNAFLTQIANDVDPRLHATVWMPGDLRWATPERRFDKPTIDNVDLTLNPTGFQVKKASNPRAAGNLGGGSSETGYIYFRYAEVLLNYAEAKFELEKVVAYDALNLLRKRVDMPDFVVNPQTTDPNRVNYGYEIPDALYEIRRERRVELALEGYRYDDFKRWRAHNLFKGKRPKGYPFDKSEFPAYNPPVDENGLIDYFKPRLPNGYQFRENQDYLSAIPVEELTINPAIKQNPGWQ